MHRRRFLAGALASVLAACRSGGSDSTAVTGATSTPPTTPVTSTVSPSTVSPPTTTAAVTWRPEVPARAPFALGVASGEPTTDTVSLWTRLVNDPLGPALGVGEVDVTWTVARDPELADTVAGGVVVATPDRAHAVQVDVSGLEPGTTWFYGFEAAGGRSMVGRTRTAPIAPDSARLAVASCQRFQDGTFVAHRHLADRELDVVVFLGDVIYADRGRGDVRPYDDDRPATLDGFRRRHARYRADPDLQACLAAHPWVVTRDDNDVAGGHGPDHELRAVAEQALAEHHPMRPIDPTDLRRALGWGDLADLILLDCRPHRSPPAGRDGPLGATVADAALDAADRTMLGDEQEAWLAERLAGSTAAWQLVGSQVMVGELAIELGDDRLLNNDQWDGYPAARDRLTALLGEASSPLLLAGDLHSGIVDVVRDATGRAVATELVTPSISSAVDDAIAAALAAAPLFRPDLLDVRAGTNGWIEVDLRRDELEARVVVLDATDDAAEPTVARSLGLDRGAAEPRLDG